MKLDKSDVQWIINCYGELGVNICGQQFYIYKGEAFTYTDPVDYRVVRKREFGESGPIGEFVEGTGL